VVVSLLSKQQVLCLCLFDIAKEIRNKLIHTHTHTHTHMKAVCKVRGLINPSPNFMEVWWRSLFRSTSLGKRCTSYNAPPTSPKRVADRWSLRNFLPRSSLLMVGESPEVSWGEIWIELCVRLGKSESVEPHQNIRHTVQISPHAISGLF
jgi:hypothetical protein